MFLPDVIKKKKAVLSLFLYARQGILVVKTSLGLLKLYYTSYLENRVRQYIIFFIAKERALL